MFVFSFQNKYVKHLPGHVGAVAAVAINVSDLFLMVRNSRLFSSPPLFKGYDF